MEKLVAAVRKLDPGYGADDGTATRGMKGQVLSLSAQGGPKRAPETQQELAAKKLSSFSTRVKDVLLKINE